MELFVDAFPVVWFAAFFFGEEAAEFTGDKGSIGPGIVAEIADHLSAAFGIGIGGRFGPGIGFALMPEDAFECAGLLSDFQSCDGSVVEVAIFLPAGQGSAPDGAGNQPDGDIGAGIGHGLSEGGSDPGCGDGLIEVQWFGGGDPFVGFVEHEDSGVHGQRFTGERPAAGHIGLADEQIQVQIFGGGRFIGVCGQWERSEGEQGQYDQASWAGQRHDVRQLLCQEQAIRCNKGMVFCSFAKVTPALGRRSRLPAGSAVRVAVATTSPRWDEVAGDPPAPGGSRCREPGLRLQHFASLDEVAGVRPRAFST